MQHGGASPLLLPLRFFETADAVFDCAWSELNSAHVLAASGDGSVTLWDAHAPTAAAAAAPFAAFCEHSGEVNGVDWNLVAKDTFASCSWDHTLKIWSPERAASLATLAEHAAAVYEARWAPRHPTRLLSASADRTVKLWDPTAGSGAVLSVAGETEVLSLDWSKYEEHAFASASADRAVRHWDLRALAQPTHTLAAHGAAARRVRCSPHAPAVSASASYDTSVCLWNVALAPASPLAMRYSSHREFACGLEFSLFDPSILFSCGWDSQLCVHIVPPPARVAGA